MTQQITPKTLTIAKYDHKAGLFNKGDFIVMNDDGEWVKNELQADLVDCDGTVIRSATQQIDFLIILANQYQGKMYIAGDILQALGRKRRMSIDSFEVWCAKKNPNRSAYQDALLAVNSGQMNIIDFELRWG